MQSRAEPAVQALKTERERLGRQYAASPAGKPSSEALTDAVDRSIQAVWARVGAPDSAVVALGGYGRRELCPGSDIDLMVLHHKGRDVAEAARCLFYSLWDTGLQVGNSVRTLKEAVRLARTNLDAQTAFLDTRLVAGDVDLSEQFRRETLSQVRRSSSEFLGRLREATDARHQRAGDASSELEPNVKEGRGGLRDLSTIRWIRMASGRRDQRISDESLAEARESLLRIRWALHLLTERQTDILMAHLRRPAAEMLGYEGDAARAMEDESGAAKALTPEDLLLRDLYLAARTIGLALDLLLDPPTSDAYGRVSPERFATPSWTPRDRAAFVDILAGGEGGRAGFRVLDATGALARALPEWRAIHCLPQRNPYHHRSVDAHAFETVVELVRLPGGGRLARRVAEDVRDRWDRLLVAALLHDIGKGGDGDHAAEGEAVARSAARRMGFDDDAAGEIAWLVRHHLLLSRTATRRNVYEERLVIELADTIGTPDRLRMLYLLSVADGRATGPEAWSDWKDTLVSELFSEVHGVLEKGELSSPNATKTAKARIAELREALARFPADRVEAHIDAMPRAWLLSQPADALFTQSVLMLEAPPGELRMDARQSEGGTWEVRFVAPDRPGLISKVSGALALHGLNVVAADIYTREDGVALQSFRVQPVDEDEERFRKVVADIRKALRGRIAFDVRLAEKRRQYPAPSAGLAAPRVVVDNRSSDFYTVIEVHAADAIGLLFTITRALSDLELDIHMAKVATYGREVVDAFYVWDLDRQKVTDPDHVGEIERTVLHRLKVESTS
ncbi:MAG: ACT domain-containing protein [Actinomycetota bacterium]